MPRKKRQTYPRPWITAARKISNGMTQTELGEKIGKSKPAVSAYEVGIRWPDIDTARDILDALPILKQQGYTIESFYPKREQ